jgi:hypothetical protein
MTAPGLACVTCGTALSENVEAVKSTVPQQMRGEIIPKLEQPEERRASEVYTRALDEADDGYDPAELAEVDDEL